MVPVTPARDGRPQGVDCSPPGDSPGSPGRWAVEAGTLAARVQSGTKHLERLHRRALSARENLRTRTREQEELVRKTQDGASLGFKVGTRRVAIDELAKTNRGRAVEGVSGIMAATTRAKHAMEKMQISNRDVKGFLAGCEAGNTTANEKAGMTWVASSTMAVYRTPRRKLSEQEMRATHSALRAVPGMRTAAQRVSLRQVLASVDLFSKLSVEEIDRLAEVVGVDEFDDGDVIMTEGEPGEEFCIVLSGKVDIILGGRHARRQQARQHSKTITSRDGDKRPNDMSCSSSAVSLRSQSVRDRSPRRNVKNDEPGVPRRSMTAEELKKWDGVTVGQLTDGAAFGELALLDSKGVRSATAVAVGPTTLVLIARRDFTRLVAKLIQDKTQARLDLLKKQHYAFASWSTERLIKLSNFMVPFAFARNTVIATQSADIKHVFIVSDGAVRVATDVRVGENDQSTHKGQQQRPHQLHFPPSLHPIHSPRPGKTLMDSRTDASGTVQLALLGPGSVIGEVELAVGRRQYHSTYIASTEVKGFLMSEHEYMQRLDPTTLHNIRNVSKEVLKNRCERIDALSFRALDVMEQRQQKQQKKQQQQQQQQQQQNAQPGGIASTAVKHPVRPASAPPGRRSATRHPPTPPRGNLGLCISLGLRPGTVAFPIDPADARVRDRHAAHLRVPNLPIDREYRLGSARQPVGNDARALTKRDRVHPQAKTAAVETDCSVGLLSDAVKLRARVQSTRK